jgi:hypothetical protein
MKLLKFLTLIVLVQVGSNLWINPKQIVGIKTNLFHECSTIIIFAGGGGGSQYAYECSDWNFNKVKAALEGTSK